MTDKLISAIHFSARQHAGQFRKDGKTPYINHPIHVMHLISVFGKVEDIDILSAAVLHDVLEDTPINEKVLEIYFGGEVLALVKEVTDDKTTPKEERKRLQVERAPQLSHGARLIRIADKISNVNDMVVAPPKGWDNAERNRYVSWTKLVVDSIRGTNAALEAIYDKVLAESQKHF